MSDGETPKAVVRKLIEDVWNHKRLHAIPDVFHADATLNLAAGPLTGTDAIRGDYIGPILTAFPDLQIHIVDLFADGDRIAMRFTGSGVHRGDFAGRAATGNRLDYGGLVLFHMRDNRIAEAWANSNWDRKFAEL